LPRAVFGAGVLTATLSTASAVAAVTLKDEDAGDLHERLRGMEDGDSRWGFGQLFRVSGGKQEAVTEGDTSVAAEQGYVSLKENNLVFLSCWNQIGFGFKIGLGLKVGLGT
jgi:hypothetical protein